MLAALRVCTDDDDFACVSELGETLLLALPDEPRIHVQLAHALVERGEDVSAAAPEYVAFAEAFGSSPARIELVRLSWRLAEYRQRLRTELPSPALARTRGELLADLSRFEPEQPSEAVRARMLEIAMVLSEEGDAASVGLSMADFVEESGEPSALFAVALAIDRAAEADPAVRAAQQPLLDGLLLSDPASPRYPAYLLLHARALPDEAEKRAAYRAFLDGGVPDPYEDDAWTLYAGSHRPRTLPEDARRYLEGMLAEGARWRNATPNAALILATEDSAWGRPRSALGWLERIERFGHPPKPEVVKAKARVLSSMRRHSDALVTLQESLLRGGTDYDRWFLAARQHQALGNEPEAVRLLQFYLLQLNERASGALPFGPPVRLQTLAAEHAKVWYRIVEMHPAFFGRSGVRQFVELLALIAAGLLAAARFRRARAFLLPGLFAAEVVFFAGLVGLRASQDGAPIPALHWVWLGTASLRAFVLVAAGLYVSALAGLPRHTRSLAGPAIAAAAAAVCGAAFGLTQPPMFVLEGMPGFARVAELGLAPERGAEVPVLLVSALRQEAAARLVWPALILTAIPAVA